MKILIADNHQLLGMGLACTEEHLVKIYNIRSRRFE